MPKHQLLIIDDHYLFGEGLKELLSKQKELHIEGPEKDVKRIESMLSQNTPELILMDINLSGLNGIELGAKIKEDYPDIKIIILTMYDQKTFFKQAQEAKMDGYLLKDCDSAILLKGIFEVLKGGTYFYEITDTKSHYLPENDDFANKYKLSERELEIIKHICNGLNNKQIAETISLSYHTVKSHRKNIYFKLGISHITELIELMKT